MRVAQRARMAQHAKSKKRPLRPPFLVTVATIVGAVAPGCGGAVSTENAGGSAGSDPGSTTTSAGGASGVTTGMTTAVTTGTTTGTGAGGNGAGGTSSMGCPMSPPTNGMFCPVPGQMCVYPFCGRPADLRFTCVGGSWQEQATGSCNPPPPQPCPMTEPLAGSSCMNFTLQVCSYADVCCNVTRGTRDYRCNGITWQRVLGDAGDQVDSEACRPCPDDTAYPDASVVTPAADAS